MLGFDRRGWNGDEATLGSSWQFRRGVDLYHSGLFWDAHEAWERLWRQTERGTNLHAFLQGLIQCAGSALKAKDGRVVGCRRLADKGLSKLSSVAAASPGAFAGIDLRTFITAFRAYSHTAAPDVNPPKLE